MMIRQLCNLLRTADPDAQVHIKVNRRAPRVLLGVTIEDNEVTLHTQGPIVSWYLRHFDSGKHVVLHLSTEE